MPYRRLTKEREERRVSVILYGGTLVLLFILLYATYNNIQHYRETVVRVRGYNLALLELESAFSSVQDKETGVRGFMLTRDTSYLRAYSLPKEVFQRHFRTADSLLGLNAFRGRTAALQNMGNSVGDILDKLAAIERPGMALTAEEAQIMERSKVGMDAYRKANKAFVNDIRAERALLLMNDMRNGLNTPAMVIVYSLLAILATAVLFWRLNRALFRVEKASLDLSAKVIELDHVARAHAEAQHMLEEVLDISPNGIMTLRAVRDKAGEIVDLEFVTMNHQAKKAVDNKDLVGEKLLKEMGNAVDRTRYKAYLEVIDTGVPFQGQFSREQEGILRWYTNHVVRFNDGIMVTFSDITEQKRLEGLYSEADRQQLTNQIVRTVAHEVRNPLTNIHLALGELQDTMPPGSAEDDMFMNIITRNLDRIGRLIKEMLESSQMRELKLVPCVMEEIVRDAIGNVKDRLDLKEMEHHVRVEKDLPLFMADPDLIQLAITNITVNAIEAMELGKGELSIHVHGTGAGMIMDITDNGKGIPPEQLGRLFEPFHSGRTGGLGLGLTASRSILNGHRVQLSVRSEVNKGSTFSLSFPKEILVIPEALPMAQGQG